MRSSLGNHAARPTELARWSLLSIALSALLCACSDEPGGHGALDGSGDGSDGGADTTTDSSSGDVEDPTDVPNIDESARDEATDLLDLGEAGDGAIFEDGSGSDRDSADGDADAGNVSDGVSRDAGDSYLDADASGGSGMPCTWSPARMVPGSEGACCPEVAINGSGDAIVSLRTDDPESTERFLLTSMYDAGTGSWGAATPVVSEPQGVRHHLGLDDQGNALVVFCRDRPGEPWVLRAARYTPLDGWGDPDVLRTITSDIASPFGLEMSPAGSALVEWRYEGWFRAGPVEAIPFEPSTGWGEVTRLSAEDTIAGGEAMSIDSNGNALVVWTIEAAPEDASHGVWAAGHSPTMGWSEPVQISPVDVSFHDLYSFRMGLDDFGDAVLAWRTGWRVDDEVQCTAARYEPTAGWGEPFSFEGDGCLHGPGPVNGLGVGTAFWVTSERTSAEIPPEHFGLWATYFSLDSGSEDSVELAEPATVKYVVTARLDTAGNLFAVWGEYGLEDDSAAIHAAYHGLDGEWSEIVTLTRYIPGETPLPYAPELATNSTGGAIAAWEAHDGTEWSVWYATCE